MNAVDKQEVQLYDQRTENVRLPLARARWTLCMEETVAAVSRSTVYIPLNFYCNKRLNNDIKMYVLLLP